jgi:hypothetical protein
MITVDRKYTGILSKADGTVIKDWIVFRAKDKLVPEMIEAYIQMCIDNDCEVSHILGMESLLKRVREYQEMFPETVKIPDTTIKDMIFDATEEMEEAEDDSG